MEINEMIKPTAVFALKFSSGIIGRYQYFDNPTAKNVERSLRRSDFGGLGRLISWRQVDPSAFPANPDFKEAWVDDGKTISIDMAKARDIHRRRLRAARSPLLQALDIEYQRADERGDAAAKAAIAKSKQDLRNVTADPAIEAATTPEELALVVPAVLVGA